MSVFAPFALFNANGLYLQGSEAPVVNTQPSSAEAMVPAAKLNSGAIITEGSDGFTHSSANSMTSDISGQHPRSVAPANAAGEVPHDDHTPNLYVASLPASFTDEELYNLFAPFGPIASSTLMYTKPNIEGRRHCRGYGFVQYVHEKDAALAQSQMIGHVVGGNRIQVRRAKSGSVPVKPAVHVPNTTVHRDPTPAAAPAPAPAPLVQALPLTYAAPMPITAPTAPTAAFFAPSPAPNIAAAAPLGVTVPAGICGAPEYVLGADGQLYLILRTAGIA